MSVAGKPSFVLFLTLGVFFCLLCRLKAEISLREDLFLEKRAPEYQEYHYFRERGDDDDGGGQCASPADCNENGDCVMSSEGLVCDCDSDYAGSTCEDERRDLVTAILLYVFLGQFGAGDFYSGRTTIAIIKLCMWCWACYKICIPFIGWMQCSPLNLALMIWNIVTIIMILAGALGDGDGHDYK